MLDAHATKSGAVDTAGAVRWGGRRGRTGADDEFQFQIKAAISRHSGASRNPDGVCGETWIPAFAGMTVMDALNWEWKKAVPAAVIKKGLILRSALERIPEPCGIERTRGDKRMVSSCTRAKPTGGVGFALATLPAR